MDYSQMNIFDWLGDNAFENGGGSVSQIAINKPIRLIELFAG